MNTLIASLSLSLSLSILLHAQALTGKWQGETPNGAQIVFDVKATSTTLHGTLTQRDETATITDGKVSKNRFTFNVTMGGGPEGFTGEISGDEIRMWLDRRGPSSTVVLKRAK